MRFVFGALAIACLLWAGCNNNNQTDLSTAPNAGPPTTPGAGGPAGGPPSGGPSGGVGAPEAANAGVIQLTPENTKIGFVGTHAGDKPDPRTGSFEKFTGQVEVDPDAKTLKSASVEIDAASLRTEFPKLTTHLNSPDFLDTREYPTITFESAQIAPSGEGQANITGNLTLHGATKEVSFPATYSITDEGLTLQGEFTIDRTEFGMDKLQENVVKEVQVTVAVDHTAAQASAGGPPGGGGGGRLGPNFSPMMIFKQMDANSDNQLTGEEISGPVKDNLQTIDKDGNGNVSQEEYQAYMSQF